MGYSYFCFDVSSIAYLDRIWRGWNWEFSCVDSIASENGVGKGVNGDFWLNYGIFSFFFFSMEVFLLPSYGVCLEGVCWVVNGRGGKLLEDVCGEEGRENGGNESGGLSCSV